MPNSLDPFSAQIVELVRSMPDEAILELVRSQLGGGGGGAGSSLRAVARAVRRTAGAPAAPRRVGRPKGKGRRRRASSADRQKLLSEVERAVKSSRGLSASELAKKVGQPQSRVTAAVRELKSARRIFQGGDRHRAQERRGPAQEEQEEVAIA
jgi:hypothetical protein